MNLKKIIRNSVLKRMIIPCSMLVGLVCRVIETPSRRQSMVEIYEQQAVELGLSEPLYHVPSIESLMVPYIVMTLIVLLIVLYISRGLINSQKTQLGKSIKRYVPANVEYQTALEEAQNDLKEVRFESKGIKAGSNWVVGRVGPWGHKAIDMRKVIGVYRCDFTYNNYKTHTSRMEYNIMFLDKDKKETKIIIGSREKREDVYFYFYNQYPNILHGNYEEYIESFKNKTEIEKDVIISRITNTF